MREILFRGKRRDNGEWEFGNLIISPYVKNCVMIERLERKNGYFATNAVDPESVGQYIDRKDKNGKRIFEGDVVRYGKTHVGVINYNDCCFCVKLKEKGWMNKNNPAMDIVENEYPNEIEIIGNIHDHPDLNERSESK